MWFDCHTCGGRFEVPASTVAHFGVLVECPACSPSLHRQVLRRLVVHDPAECPVCRPELGSDGVPEQEE